MCLFCRYSLLQLKRIAIYLWFFGCSWFLIESDSYFRYLSSFSSSYFSSLIGLDFPLVIWHMSISQLQYSGEKSQSLQGSVSIIIFYPFPRCISAFWSLFIVARMFMSITYHCTCHIPFVIVWDKFI